MLIVLLHFVDLELGRMMRLMLKLGRLLSLDTRARSHQCFLHSLILSFHSKRLYRPSPNYNIEDQIENYNELKI